MVTDTGLIVCSVISLIGMLIFFTINNNNWFKRQNFKVQVANVKAENKLKIKKLERELGINTTSKSVSSLSTDTPNILSSLAPILKNLDGDQLKGLAEQFLPEAAEETEPDGIGGMLLNFAQENPEIVEGLLQGITKGKEALGGDSSETPPTY